MKITIDIYTFGLVDVLNFSFHKQLDFLKQMCHKKDTFFQKMKE